MSSISKILGGTAVALTLMAGATQASAALITEWGYQIESGFSAFAPAGAIPAGVEGSDPNAGGVAPVNGLPTTLSWGDPGSPGGDPSSLEVTPSVSNPPNLFTNGAAVNGASITHNNNVITGDSIALDTATLLTALILTPINPPGAPVGPIVIPFFIQFEETVNEPDSGVCTPGTGGTPCADIFVLGDPGALTFDFSLMGVDYTADLDVEGFGPLSDAACAAAGALAGCVGFITPENQSTTLDTTFTITAKVPEPGTLALLGLGLIGLGFARKRKVAA